MPPRPLPTLEGEQSPSPTARLAQHPQSSGQAPPAPLADPAPPGPVERWEDAELRQLRDALDHIAHAGLARLTGGLSPAALVGAFLDWAAHLAISPGKQIELGAKGTRKWARLAHFATRCAVNGGTCEPCIEPLSQDRRFTEPEWRQWPYNLIQQSFLLQQQWWANATTDVDGVTKQHQAVVEFAMRQLLDMASPSNFIATNPVVRRRIAETGGQNLVQGFRNFLDDWERIVRSKAAAGTEAFRRAWRDAYGKSGLTEDLHFHDLRGTAVTMLDEAGRTVPEIATITGHSVAHVQEIIDRYLARTRELAESAIAKLDEHRRNKKFAK